MALKVTIGMNPEQTVYEAVDVNGNGKIGIAEVLYILRCLTGLRAG